MFECMHCNTRRIVHHARFSPAYTLPLQRSAKFTERATAAGAPVETKSPCGYWRAPSWRMAKVCAANIVHANGDPVRNELR